MDGSLRALHLEMRARGESVERVGSSVEQRDGRGSMSGGWSAERVKGGFAMFQAGLVNGLGAILDRRRRSRELQVGTSRTGQLKREVWDGKEWVVRGGGHPSLQSGPGRQTQTPVLMCEPQAVCEKAEKDSAGDIPIEDWMKKDIPKINYLKLSDKEIVRKEMQCQMQSSLDALNKLRKQQKDRIQQALEEENKKEEEEAKKEELELENHPYLLERALFIFPPENPVRKAATAIVRHPWFDWIILVFILISSVMLAVEHPRVEPDSPLGVFLKQADLVFTIIFLVELLLKLITFGGFLHKGAYFRSPANVLDSMIVATAVISIILNDDSLSVMKSFRLLRTLRPLRMVSRLKGLQIVVTCLIYSMPSVLNVVLFGCFEFGVFGILGVQLFAGKFYYCTDPSATGKADCVGFMETADGLVEREWVNSFFNFDNVAEAIKALFVVATLDDWMRITYSCIDATEVDMQPQENNNPIMVLYIILFVFLGSFFWVNLLVGVMIDQYNRLIVEMGDDVMLTADQVTWMSALQLKQHAAKDLKDIPENPFRAKCYLLVTNTKFEMFIIGSILVNILFMASESYQQSESYTNILKIVNIIFTMIFTSEAVIKAIGLGPEKYIADDWNKLDLFIVCVSLPELAVNLGVGATVFRIFRIGRMFKMVQSAIGLRTLFNTLLTSLPAVVNVGSLLFLLMFVYGILGMNLYGTIPFSPHANFHTFGQSLSTLFRVFTGDGWSLLLYSAYKCDTEEGCETGLLPVIYFVSFNVLGGLVMLNLIIAVVLDKFVVSATAEGLLRSDDFFEVLRKKLIMDRFLNKLMVKIRQWRIDNGLPADRRASAFAVLGRASRKLSLMSINKKTQGANAAD